jgi:hypothetical protein
MACGRLCDDKEITPEQAFKKLIAVSDGNCPALRVQAVAPKNGDECLNFMECTNKEETWRQIFFQMVDTTDPDCWKLNVVDAT